MLRVFSILLFSLSCSTILCNPISSIYIDKIMDTHPLFESYNPDCRRISKTNSLSSEHIETCKSLTRQLRKDIQRIHFKSNKKLQDVFKDRQRLYATQHKVSNISLSLQSLSDRYQNAKISEYNQLADLLKAFNQKIDHKLKLEIYSKQDSKAILQKRYSELSLAINDVASHQDKHIVLNHSKSFKSKMPLSLLNSYPPLYGKDLFNYILDSPNPNSLVILLSIHKSVSSLPAPKTYNKLSNLTSDVIQRLRSNSSAGPKKVTVSSWRDPATNSGGEKSAASKRNTSLKEVFSSIFSNTDKTALEIKRNPTNSHISSQYAYVQLPVLIAFHPEMMKFDSKTKRFISANPNNFVKDGFFQGFRKKFLRGNVDTNTFEQVSKLQALESSRLIDIVNSEKQQKAIYRNIQNTVKQLVNRHNLKTVFYDNIKISTQGLPFNHKSVVLNTNVSDFTKKALISLYANSDQQVLEKVISSLRQARLID